MSKSLIDVFNDEKPLITLMRGLPRSGKSTWIATNKKSSDIIVSPDEIRKEIFGHKFFKPAESFVWGMTRAFLTLLMQQQKDIIVDATHVTSYAITQYDDLIQKYQYRTKLVWVKANLKTCLKRNAKTTKIPAKVLEDMALFEDHYDIDYEQCKFDFAILVERGRATRIK